MLYKYCALPADAHTRCSLPLCGVDKSLCCVEMCRIVSFTGESEILTDILGDVLKSFEEVCIVSHSV